AGRALGDLPVCGTLVGAGCVCGYPRILRCAHGRLRLPVATRRHRLGPLGDPQRTGADSRCRNLLRNPGAGWQEFVTDACDSAIALGVQNMGVAEGFFPENVLTTTIEQGIAWARESSMWP